MPQLSFIILVITIIKHLTHFEYIEMEAVA